MIQWGFLLFLCVPVWTTKPQSDSFSSASFMFSSLVEEIVSTKCLYWVSALNLFLEKPFFLCWVLRSHRILAACVSTLASVVWIPPPLETWTLFSRWDCYKNNFFFGCTWAILVNMFIFWSRICAVSVQSYYSVTVVLRVVL